ncbi:MAG: AMP-binding protein [Nakamurella sp.]
MTDPWTPALTLPGVGSSPALLLDGTALTKAAVLKAADRVDVSQGLVDARGRPHTEMLVGVVAAARARVPVVIGTGPDTPPPPPGSLPADAFLVVARSGSSAAPRTVVRTLRSWTSSYPGYSALTGLGAGDRLLLTGPLSSTLQLFAAVQALACGVLVTDEPAVANAAVCVPARLDAVVAAAPHLRSVVVAGARLSEQAAHRAADAGIAVAEYYGAAELSFVAARRWPERLTPFPGVEVQIRDRRLWSRSAFHCSQISGSPGGFAGDTTGFATVGDVAWLHGDGSLTILGRGSEAVLVGGRTVIVEDVEATIGSLHGVRDVAVAAQPHARLGATLVAMVALTDGALLPGVRDRARAVLDPEWMPRRWVVVEDVPRTAPGKIDRRAVRAAMTP